MSARRLLLAAVVVATTLATALAAPASAVDSVAIRQVDSTAFPAVKVQVVVNGETPDPATIKVLEDGTYVQPTAVTPTGRSDLPLGMVLVIDTSGSMRQAGKMDRARDTAKRVIAEKGPKDELAVVGFGDRATVLQGFTSDTAQLARVVDSLTAVGETSLFDGIRLGAGLFSDRRDLQANLLVISDGKDTVSTQGFDEARSTAVLAKARVFALGLAGGTDYDAGPLRQLAGETGGDYLETADAAGLEELGSRVQRNLANQYEITYTSAAKEPFDLTVAIGRVQATSPKVAPGRLVEARQVAPREFKAPASVGPLRSSSGAYIVMGLVFAFLTLLAFAVGTLVLRSRADLDTTLDLYTLEQQGPDIVDGDDADRHSLVESGLVKRAVAVTEHIAERRGVLVGLERKLEQADIKLRAGEVVFFTGMAAVLLTALVLTLAGLMAAILVALLAALGPNMFLGLAAARRRRKFVSQLPDTLNLLSGTLRSGYALLQGLDAVANEAEDPMAGELRRTLIEAQLGRDVNDALAECATRMGSADFEWAVMAINIQREVGGNLAELLDTVADTMVQRERLRRDVAALTAEGKMSAIVLGALAPGLGLVMWLMNPEYVGKLFSDTTGNIMLGIATVVALAGFAWMKKIITIDI